MKILNHQPLNQIPEPGTLVLLNMGIISVVFYEFRHRRKVR